MSRKANLANGETPARVLRQRPNNNDKPIRHADKYRLDLTSSPSIRTAWRTTADSPINYLKPKTGQNRINCWNQLFQKYEQPKSQQSDESAIDVSEIVSTVQHEMNVKNRYNTRPTKVAFVSLVHTKRRPNIGSRSFLNVKRKRRGRRNIGLKQSHDKENTSDCKPSSIDNSNAESDSKSYASDLPVETAKKTSNTSMLASQLNGVYIEDNDGEIIATPHLRKSPNKKELSKLISTDSTNFDTSYKTSKENIRKSSRFIKVPQRYNTNDIENVPVPVICNGDIVRSPRLSISSRLKRRCNQSITKENSPKVNPSRKNSFFKQNSLDVSCSRPSPMLTPTRKSPANVRNLNINTNVDVLSDKCAQTNEQVVHLKSPVAEKRRSELEMEIDALFSSPCKRKKNDESFNAEAGDDAVQHESTLSSEEEQFKMPTKRPRGRPRIYTNGKREPWMPKQRYVKRSIEFDNHLTRQKTENSEKIQLMKSFEQFSSLLSSMFASHNQHFFQQLLANNNASSNGTNSAIFERFFRGGNLLPGIAASSDAVSVCSNQFGDAQSTASGAPRGDLSELMSRQTVIGRKIEDELNSELGYMVYKRYLCNRNGKRLEFGFWDDSVRAELQRLSEVVPMEDLYDYMKSACRTWIARTSAHPSNFS